MNKLFYPKLAISNILKNKKIYIPYTLTSICMIAMFYIMASLYQNESIQDMPKSGDILSIMLGLGMHVIGIFAGLILFYANGFLIKQRKKELGLYNILGMEKRHIAKMLLMENLFASFGSILLGLFAGTLLSRLMYLLLMRIINFDVFLQLPISIPSLIRTIILFVIIFSVILLYNMLKVRLTNPIDLLKGGQVGETEPKTKGVIAISGFVALGIAYYLALTIKHPSEELETFFIAVMLVIIGTYCLFIAGSIVILKLLRNNKKLYYRSQYFTAISGMIYRMKQHAAGLASICILSTMVFVTIITTVSLYIGLEDALRLEFPREYTIASLNMSPEKIELLYEIVQDEANKHELVPENFMSYKSSSLLLTDNNGVFENAGEFPDLNTLYVMILMEIEDYNALTGHNDSIAENEVLLYGASKDISNMINMAGKSFEIIKRLDESPIQVHMANVLIMVVHNMDIASDLVYHMTGEKIEELDYFLAFDLDLDDDRATEFISEVNNQLELANINTSLPLRSIHEVRVDALVMVGGLLFLGIFLGVLFLMATGLIIYYKQISEGYEDRERFHIMQKVGMSKDEVKKTIQTQTLMVFFLPLMMAIIHIAFAFKVMTKLLGLIIPTNTGLFFTCTVITILVFVIIYGMLYHFTAKVYYKIVN